MTAYYKVTGPDGSPIHGGSGPWPLPKVDRLGRRHPGRWRKVEGPLRLCSNGLHLTTEEHLRRWTGARFIVWLAQTRGEVLEEPLEDKVAAREVRLVKPVIEVLTPEHLRRWKRFTGLDHPDGLVAEWNRKPVTPPLVFGRDALEIEERICPAWPSASSLDRRNWTRTIRRSGKLLGIPAPLDRAAARFLKAGQVAEAYALLTIVV